MVTTSPAVPSPGADSPDGPGGPGGSGPQGPGADDGTPSPSYEPMSIRAGPLIDIGLAVVILLGGVAAAAFSSRTNPTFTIRHVTLDDGTTVNLVPSSRVTCR